MFDHIETQQLLPAYPSSIKGELRIILQVKDQFLICFKHMENLTSLWEQQNRIITKEFIIEQVKSGDSEIELLEEELKFEKELTKSKNQVNDNLILQLQNHGEHAIADSSKRRVKSCKMALFKSCNKDLKDFLYTKDSSFLSILQNIGDRIDSAQEELRHKLRPLLEFYKDLFYLQLHFTLALTQISCFCMPLMTDSISLIDRLFFWTERPEFELIKRSGQICDRLRDIYTRLQRILNRLFDSVHFLQDRIELQRLLEIKFYEKMKLISATKDDILDTIHSMRLSTDLLEEENDRLVGTLIKIDPSFTSSEMFKLYSEQRNLSHKQSNNKSVFFKTSTGITSYDDGNDSITYPNNDALPNTRLLPLKTSTSRNDFESMPERKSIIGPTIKAKKTESDAKSKDSMKSSHSTDSPLNMKSTAGQSGKSKPEGKSMNGQKKVANTKSLSKNNKYDMTSSENSHHINMSNFVSTEIVADSQNNERDDKLINWKNQILDILSLMKTRQSMSDSRLPRFSELGVELENANIFSVPLSKKAEKYKMEIHEEGAHSSDLNQTTDALVMTSEILPKDD